LPTPQFIPEQERQEANRCFLFRGYYENRLNLAYAHGLLARLTWFEAFVSPVLVPSNKYFDDTEKADIKRALDHGYDLYHAEMLQAYSSNSAPSDGTNLASTAVDQGGDWNRDESGSESGSESDGEQSRGEGGGEEENTVSGSG
jgi:hypothetical protein